ncbi:Mini-ribonuclease 3 [Marininema halotolerans]|uniref:Mini-ribonuclease 3 n=1 Tax=Marininema halotolerans TaxID=1155944 RepID=A0A1I6T7W7_9BACL|nr:ribonuclease III domain-containing protein [Marininema halotolerans]SFS85223.1 ribonuclease-3 family protein [Marininema halotolerans]
MEIGMTKSVDMKETKEMNPLQLAYLGDAIYELYIRYHLVIGSDIRPKELHDEAIRFVAAPAQARGMRAVEEQLTEEEWEVLKRGRNAKSGGVPKSAKPSEYRYATGLETLVAHWYLTGQVDRLTDMMKRMIQALEEGENDGE